jgi:hypothetical protein
MLKNELEYLHYVNEHIHNVNEAFFLLKDVFKLKLTENEYRDLNERVVNHDNTKFLPPEFQGYCQWFNPADGATKNRAIFEAAWKHHYTYNDHHPEHWYIDDNTAKEMPLVAVCEMLCDWLAMSMKFYNLPSAWYKGKMKKDPFILHPNTQALIEKNLPVLDEAFKRYKSGKEFNDLVKEWL